MILVLKVERILKGGALCEDCDWAVTEAVIEGEPAMKVDRKDANGSVCSCVSCFTPEFVLIFSQSYLPPGTITAVERAIPWCVACHHPIENSDRRFARVETFDLHARASSGFG